MQRTARAPCAPPRLPARRRARPPAAPVAVLSSTASPLTSRRTCWRRAPTARSTASSRRRSLTDSEMLFAAPTAPSASVPASSTRTRRVTVTAMSVSVAGQPRWGVDAEAVEPADVPVDEAPDAFHRRPVVEHDAGQLERSLGVDPDRCRPVHQRRADQGGVAVDTSHDQRRIPTGGGAQRHPVAHPSAQGACGRIGQQRRSGAASRILPGLERVAERGAELEDRSGILEWCRAHQGSVPSGPISDPLTRLRSTYPRLSCAPSLASSAAASTCTTPAAPQVQVGCGAAGELVVDRGADGLADGHHGADQRERDEQGGDDRAGPAWVAPRLGSRHPQDGVSPGGPPDQTEQREHPDEQHAAAGATGPPCAQN